MKTTANSTAVKRYLEDLLDGLDYQSQDAKDTTTNLFDQKTTDLQRSAHRMARKATHAARQSKKTVSRGTEDLLDLAGAHPGATAALAGATGFLLGGVLLYSATRLLKRANDRRDRQLQVDDMDEDMIIEVDAVESHVSEPIEIPEEEMNHPGRENTPVDAQSSN